MTTQEHDPNGIVQYMSYSLRYSSVRARVTWTCPSRPEEPQKREVLIQYHTTFHPFSKLPLELRLKVWNYASPPRVIEIRSWGDTSRNPLTPIKFSTPPQKPPVIFRVNRESREEALRLYTVVEIGSSTSALEPNQEYLDWKHHPSNPHRQFRAFMYEAIPYRQPLVKPYPAQKTYVDFSRDTIYLGPEFQSRHLEGFFTATGPRMELAGLQYLAIDRKLWMSKLDSRADAFRSALYSLKSRPIKEVYIVPDDVKGCLEDNFYYYEHDITFQEPPYKYTFRLAGSEEQSQTVTDNLRVWFERLWKDGEQKPPKVEIRSVRRNGRCLASFKDGVWEVQKVMGDMQDWKEWNPPTTL
ncbi:uncharacterized protein LY89DRAFT_687197 [Mollisia scopiformis]|uniref:2EXR domain-containing protein n=1 Tax=Mollisia scopiformis TaxID=149040 RepID=A0A194X1X9_MOLSC|nr:uncharacterized protein LY89DRAFT_687197 [Mollisia scopiformis]KUJ13847.1 hypothetical protein LY89DRAFT_687197 [Mollisia scopiformis]